VAGTNVAILMAMSVSERMPLADAKNRLSEVVDRLEREHLLAGAALPDPDREQFAGIVGVPSPPRPAPT
jgi:hypothetical protein